MENTIIYLIRHADTVKLSENVELKNLDIIWSSCYTRAKDTAKYVTIEEIEVARKKSALNYTFCNWTDGDFNRKINLLKNKRKDILSNIWRG